jgi:diguanylate cyclase
MPVAHEAWIVALSLVVAVQGSYVALGLALRIAQTTGTTRRLMLAAAAFTFAVAIWSMHFVGMLAVRVPFALDYLVLPTLLSLLASVFVVGVAVFVASLAAVMRFALPLAALILGVGIATMHYIGMLALHGSAMLHHDPAYVVASFAIAVAASALGLRFAFAPRRTLPIALAALVFGIAISGMHYVAMAGLTLEPTGGHEGHAAALSPDLLAVVVAVVAFAVSAVFFLTLVPDTGPPLAASPVAPVSPPEVQLAPPAVPARAPAQVLPIERDGATHYLPTDTIVLVQADTHYTTLFDGTARSFCPLSIGEVEARLDPERFLRVHRSYILAVAHIANLRRSGDGGVATLDTANAASVPVSRGRYPALKGRLSGGEVAVSKRE